MRLKCLFIILFSACAVTDAVAVDFMRIGLPGYYPDAEPLGQTTPQLVFDALRSNPDAFIRPTTTKGVAVVEIVDDSTRANYIFFGKGHRAYPSVMRLRRAQENGVWATRISYLVAQAADSAKNSRQK